MLVPRKVSLRYPHDDKNPPFHLPMIRMMMMMMMMMIMLMMLVPRILYPKIASFLSEALREAFGAVLTHLPLQRSEATTVASSVLRLRPGVSVSIF